MYVFAHYDFANYSHIKLIHVLMKKNNFYIHDIPVIIENRNRYEGFIMYDGQVAIGFILYINNIQRTLAPNVLILFMLIDEKYRNKGCGTLLYKNAEEIFNKNNDLLIVMEYSKFDSGPDFWRKFDFKPIKTDLRGLKYTSKGNRDSLKSFNIMEKMGCLGMSYLFKITQSN